MDTVQVKKLTNNIISHSLLLTAASNSSNETKLVGGSRQIWQLEFYPIKWSEEQRGLKNGAVKSISSHCLKASFRTMSWGILFSGSFFLQPLWLIFKIPSFFCWLHPPHISSLQENYLADIETRSWTKSWLLYITSIQCSIGFQRIKIQALCPPQ